MEEEKHSHSGHHGHGWLMIICCLVMFVGIFFLHDADGASWSWLLILLCPLMHIFMMKGMSHQDTEEEEKHHH